MRKLTDKEQEIVNEQMGIIRQSVNTIKANLDELEPFAAGDNAKGKINSVQVYIGQMNLSKTEVTSDETLNKFLTVQVRTHGAELGAELGAAHSKESMRTRLSELKQEEAINFQGKQDSFIRRFCGLVTNLLHFFVSAVPTNRNLLAEKMGKNLFFPNKLTETERASLTHILTNLSEANKTIDQAFDQLIELNKDVNRSTPEEQYTPYRTHQQK